MKTVHPVPHCLLALLLGSLTGACDVPIEEDAEPAAALAQPDAGAASADSLVAADPDVAARAAKRAETCESSEEPPPDRELTPPRGVVEPGWRVDEDDELAAQEMEHPEPTEEELQAALQYSARFANEDGTVRAFVRNADRSPD